MKNVVPEPIVSAAVAILQPYYKELSPASLIEALKHREPPQPAATLRKPLTRREAAEVLKVSISTINRFVKAGTLKAAKVGKRLIRIDSRSVENLLQTASVAELDSYKDLR